MQILNLLNLSLFFEFYKMTEQHQYDDEYNEQNIYDCNTKNNINMYNAFEQKESCFRNRHRNKLPLDNDFYNKKNRQHSSSENIRDDVETKPKSIFELDDSDDTLRDNPWLPITYNDYDISDSSDEDLYDTNDDNERERELISYNILSIHPNLMRNVLIEYQNQKTILSVKEYMLLYRNYYRIEVITSYDLTYACIYAKLRSRKQKDAIEKLIKKLAISAECEIKVPEIHLQRSRDKELWMQIEDENGLFDYKSLFDTIRQKYSKVHLVRNIEISTFQNVIGLLKSFFCHFLYATGALNPGRMFTARAPLNNSTPNQYADSTTDFNMDNNETN